MFDHIVYPSDLEKYNLTIVNSFIDYGFEETILDIPQGFNEYLLNKGREIEKKHTELGIYNPYHEDGRERDFCACSYGNLHHYNLFTFNHPFIFELHKKIRNMTIEYCQKNNIDFDKKQFLLHGFFSTGKIYRELDWHDHGNEEGHLHGFMPIDSEPSETFYYLNEQFLSIPTKNGRLVVGANAPHAKGTWKDSRPRTVIAFNIKPNLEQGFDTPYILL